MSNRGLVFWLCISGFVHSLVYFSGAVFEKSHANNEIQVSLQETPAPKVFEPVKKEKIPSIPTQSRKTVSSPSGQKSSAAKTISPKIVNSGELLSDPQKGKIFSKYFLKIKKKIYQTAEDRYFPHQSKQGQVSLIFIIDSDGDLEDVYVSSRDTRADAKTKAFAVQSVKEAAPFDSFPAILSTEKICFNLTLVFDQLSQHGEN